MFGNVTNCIVIFSNNLYVFKDFDAEGTETKSGAT